jgi:hypothetical protein
VPVVAALGRLTAQKGFDVLLEAVRRLVADGVRLQLLLGGEGRERRALERQAAGLPVRFTGFEAEPRRLFAQADVFALPSRVEALPLVLVEAVSAGLPAVATDVGDVREALGGRRRGRPAGGRRRARRALRRLLATRPTASGAAAPASRRARAPDRARMARRRGRRSCQPQRLPQHPVGLIRRAQRWSIGQTRWGQGLQPDVLAHDRLQVRRVPPAPRVARQEHRDDAAARPPPTGGPCPVSFATTTAASRSRAA